jgi:hypothetical protein
LAHLNFTVAFAWLLWDGKNFGVLDRQSTARPGLDFFVDANIITQKEDHFDRRVRENFHKVNEKMGT